MLQKGKKVAKVTILKAPQQGHTKAIQWYETKAAHTSRSEMQQLVREEIRYCHS